MDLAASKLFEFREACARRESLRASGKRVVLTNGCFDLLHAGHVFSLKSAEKLGDSLWVAINSDASVGALKGNGRPIFNEKMRAYVLSALEVVSGIFVFGGKRLTSEILAFKPDVYAKSGDYSMEKLDSGERDALQSAGVEIHFVPFLDGFSTTSMVERIKRSL
ncbi:MAG: adenylyltransferase/cytidyltransferase family protein [Puniceicoccales bacterium]|jgi:rfaE bifunctional protein nucleotidyltransferase chain/domain|nr:adenylyltransferase/cytidyltransferase family protein [Puniceicoccales bacterium]